MLYIQVFFILTALCIGGLTLRIAVINRTFRHPGVNWWAFGYGSMAMAFLVTALSVYLGDLGKDLISHILLTAGVGLVWIGTRKFLDVRVSHLHYLTLIVVLSLEVMVIGWYSLVEPVYQIRLTMTCLILLLFSVATTLTLFSARYWDRAITVAGVCYCLLALLNGVRTINILLTPDRYSYYMSDTPALIATSLFLPTLVFAQLANLYMMYGKTREPGGGED